MKKSTEKLPDVFKMSSTERAVFGTNRINALTIAHLKKVLPQLPQYIGTKIELATGGKASKFNVELLEIPFIQQIGQGWRAYLTFECGALVLFNDITIADRQYEGGGYGVSYYKRRVELGKVENGILTEVYTLKNIVRSAGLNEKFDAKQIVKLRAELEKLKDRARAMEWKIKRATNS